MKNILLALLFTVLSGVVTASEITDFTASEPSGTGPVKRLVNGGIPLPEGKYSGTGKFEISGPDGKIIPAEFTVLNKWLDGSVKWVLVQFPDTFAAGERKIYKLAESSEKQVQNNSGAEFARLFELTIRGKAQDFAVEGEQIRRVADSAVKKSWIITGKFTGVKDKTEKADYYVRVDSFAGLPGLYVRATVTADCESEYMDVAGISFSVNGTGGNRKLFTEKTEIMEDALGDTPVLKSAKLFTQTALKGWAAVSGDSGTIILACEDFAELAPIAFSASKNGFACELYAGDEPYKMKRGSATTHHLRLIVSEAKDPEALRREGTAALKNIMPVCPPEWYVSSKAFGMTAKADKEKYPKYEAMVESNFKYVNGYRQKLNEYGIKDYGDYNHNKHWGNLHYDLPWAMFEQFARSGDLRFFDWGVSAARHLIDVDHIWHHPNADMIGGVYVEGIDHNSAKGTYVGFAKNHGAYFYYYLTGDERALEAGNATGDYAIRWTRNPEDLIGNEERVIGYGLLCLVQSYKATGEIKYLKRARFVIDVLKKWQNSATGAWACDPQKAGDPRPKSPTNGCVFMLGSVFEAMIDYYELTKEADVKEMIIKGNEYLLSTLWKDGPELFSINLLVVHAPAWVYAETGDKKFIDAALKAYDIALERAEWAGGKMLAQHWRCGPRFLYIIETHPELFTEGRF